MQRILNSAKLSLLRGLNEAFRLGFPGRIRLANLAYGLLRPVPSAVRVRESGITLEIDLANRELRYIFARAYERAEASFIRDTLRPGDVSVDVGANVGFLSAVAAAAVGPHGRVYALEPDPRTFEALRVAEADSKGVIRAFQLAAADGSSDVISFYLSPAEHTMWSSGLPEHGRERVEVACVALTEFIAREHIEPAFVKIDVEGTESWVLRGLLPYLRARPGKRLPTILCEMTPHAHRSQGGSTWELCEPLVRLGYRLSAWHRNQLRDVDRTWIEGRTTTFNAVFACG